MFRQWQHWLNDCFQFSESRVRFLVWRFCDSFILFTSRLRVFLKCIRFLWMKTTVQLPTYVIRSYVAAFPNCGDKRSWLYSLCLQNSHLLTLETRKSATYFFPPHSFLIQIKIINNSSKKICFFFNHIDTRFINI